MRIVFAAAIALLSVGSFSQAAAQTAPAEVLPTCVGLPAAPTAPDGATARRQDMETARQGYEAWVGEFEAKRAACRAEIETMRARTEASTVAFNTAVRAASEAGQSWDAEFAEFNARAPRRDPRRRGN